MKTEIIVVIFMTIVQIRAQMPVPDVPAPRFFLESNPGEFDLHNVLSNDGFENIVQLLVERGDRDQLNNRDGYGNTPLHMAVHLGNLKVAKVLVKNGANLHIKNNNGKDPLELARFYGYNIEGYSRNVKSSVITKHSLNSALETIRTECEIYKAYVNDQIIGGDPVQNKREFPWMAALGYRGPTQKIEYRCGGTVISKRFVLTAAHCTPPDSGAPPAEVRLGSIKLSDQDAKRLRIEKFFRHENYNKDHKKNDIALIRLLNDISEFTLEIRPACLETESSDLLHDRHFIVGFGANTTHSYKKSNNLLKAELKAVRLEECKQAFWDKKNWASLRIDESQYCAIGPDGRADSCRGDSGGAIQVFHENPNIASIVGISSFGVGCAQGYPSIYTRVAYYADWIADRVWPDEQI